MNLEILIPFCGIILIFVIVGMFLYLGLMVIGAYGMDKNIVNQCATILFHDSYNPLGYNTEFMHKYCLKIIWNNSR